MEQRLIKNKKGTSTVEFALVLPLMLIIIFGIIEFSLILYDKAMITNASREAARAGIVFRADPNTGAYNPYTDDEIRNVVSNYLSNYLISPAGSPTFNVSAPTRIANPTTGQLSPGGQLTVTVNYNYHFVILPRLITGLVGLDPLPLAATTTMRFE